MECLWVERANAAALLHAKGRNMMSCVFQVVSASQLPIKYKQRCNDGRQKEQEEAAATQSQDCFRIIMDDKHGRKKQHSFNDK